MIQGDAIVYVAIFLIALGVVIRVAVADALRANEKRDVRPDGPGRYKVIGVDIETRMDTSMAYTAESRANAQAKGELGGIKVTAIEKVSE